MIVYISLILLITIWYELIKKHVNRNEKLFIIGAFFILFITSACRSFSVGADTQSYVDKFMNLGLKNWEWALNKSYYEIGYTIINKLLYVIVPFKRTIVIFNAFVINMGICVCIYKYSSDKFLSIYIYITLLAYTISMNAARQYVAIALVCLGYKFIEERRLIAYLIIIVLAYSIHASAVILILLYWLYDVKFTLKKTRILGAASVVTFFSLSVIGNIISYVPGFERYIRYFNDSSYLVGGRGRTFIVSLILLVLCLINFKEQTVIKVVKRESRALKLICGSKTYYIRKKCIESNGSFYNLLLWELLISTIFYFFAMKFYFMIRVAEMFAVGNILLIPLVLENIKNSRTKKTFTILIYIFLTMHLFFAIMFTIMQSTVPFTFF